MSKIQIRKLHDVKLKNPPNFRGMFLHFKPTKKINILNTHTYIYYLYIFSILTKFKGDQRSIIMSLINCLNSSFVV